MQTSMSTLLNAVQKSKQTHKIKITSDQYSHLHNHIPTQIKHYPNRNSIFKQLAFIILSLQFFCGINSISKMGVYAQTNESAANFVNFTMTGNFLITQSTNLIMDYNEQIYYKLSNYFLNLEITKQSESVFLCLCVAADCRSEMPKWDVSKILQLSQNQAAGGDLINNVICNGENFYHTSTEKELFLNFSDEIATLYKTNQHLGIIIRSKNNIAGQYNLTIQQKRNFCRRCQNAMSCDSINCSCSCQVGYLGQYCTENAIIFKLGYGSDELTKSSYQLQQKIFIQRIQLSPVQQINRALQLDSSSNTNLDSIQIQNTSKSNQYISLQVQAIVDSTNQNSTNHDQFFYFYFKKNANDRFKIYIGDQYQINSSYLSENDFVQEINFTSNNQTEMYLTALTTNTSSQQGQQNYQGQGEEQLPQENSPQLVYRISLKYSPQQTIQDYQLLIVNECNSNEKQCTNELEIQYSLKNFLNVKELVETSSKIYLIVFLALTILGFFVFCSYAIYTRIKNARNLIAMDLAKEKKQIDSESKFKKIRQKVDIDNDDIEKMKDLTGIEIDSQNNNKQASFINNNQQCGNISENVSSNKMLSYKSKQIKKLSMNKTVNVQRNIEEAVPINQISRFVKQQYKVVQHGKNEQQYISHTIGGDPKMNKQKQENREKVIKQLYPNNNAQKNGEVKANVLKEQQQQQFLNILSSSHYKNSHTQQKQIPMKESRAEYNSTANTMNNLIGNNNNNELINTNNNEICSNYNNMNELNNEFSMNNITARYNCYQNGSVNNIVYFKKEAQEQTNGVLLSKQLSIPSEASHELPQINQNNARPMSHYEFKKDDPTTDSIHKVANKDKGNEQNYNQQQTLNYITTNTSNIQTMNQVMSNQELENHSPIEDNVQADKINLASLIRHDENKTLFKQKSNKSSTKCNQSLANNLTKIATNTSKTNINDSYSEEDISSLNKAGNNEKLLTNEPEQHNKAVVVISDRENDNGSSASDFDLSQHIDIICDGYISEIKGIDGSAIQNHRRNILMMGNQDDVINENRNQAAAPQAQTQNDLHSICLQDISKIVERRINNNGEENDDAKLEDLERGVILIDNEINHNQMLQNDDIKMKMDNSFDSISKIKLETPEIFFQNCPRCQSKQHEFQLKLSKIGPDNMRPNDKYCNVCLMKAEMSEVKLADSF